MATNTILSTAPDIGRAVPTTTATDTRTAIPINSFGQTTDIVTATPKPQLQALCKTKILINEVSSQTHFIELSDGGRGNTDLSGYVLVLFDVTSNSSYFTAPLTGYKTDKNGYFLLGGESLDPDILVSPNSVQYSGTAVALYIDSPVKFPIGSSPKRSQIADVIVYGENKSATELLLNILQPYDYQINVDWELDLSAGEESFSRCWSHDQVDPESFVITHSTPRHPNNCSGHPTSSPKPSTSIAKMMCQVFGRQSLLSTSLEILINEIITDQETSDAEFVELYDGGRGNSSLDGYALYILSGSSTKVTCTNMNGYQTNSAGYFLIGTQSVKPSPSIIQDVLDVDSGAIVLYSNQTQCLSFLSVQNLVDAVVFGSGPKIEAFLSILTPLDKTFPYSPSAGCSIARTADRLPSDLLSFSLQLPTPGKPAGRSPCPISVIPTLVINEINEGDIQFLELYDGGAGNTNLDGFVVVFFDGGLKNDGSYLTIDLDGQQTDANGYFLIGTSLVALSVNLLQHNGFLRKGQGAVGIYWASPKRFPDGSVPTQKGLVDAVVYSHGTPIDYDLGYALFNEQMQGYENNSYVYNGGETLNRCNCCVPLHLQAFGKGAPTPCNDHESFFLPCVSR
jgi:hypothetical protein